MRTSIATQLKATLLAFPVLLTAASLAQAATFTANLPNPLDTTLYFTTRQVPVGDFDDLYNFTIAPGDVNASFAAVALNLPVPVGPGHVLDIVGFTGNLFDNGTNVGSLQYDTTLLEYVLKGNFATGPADHYTLELTGTADGSAGGFYSLAMVAAPVPEPSTAMAAIAGLALLGFAVRRRRETEF